ncbi:MAG: hypothetical protein H6567_10165 [Lewinellaceae bacterium]|nr:hypothetical protein [Lewinellaceae bacterium]
MKSIIKNFFTLLFLGAFMVPASAQFDDLYYDYTKDKHVYTTSTNTQVNNTNQDYAYNSYDSSYDNGYDSDEYDNYDEYSYTERIRRSRQPYAYNYYYSDFDSWWGGPDYYYNPYYNNGVNIVFSFGSPWYGYSRYNRHRLWYNPWNYNPWSYSYWGSPYSYSSWNYSPYYGWNSWESGYYHNSHCGSPYYGYTNYGHGGLYGNNGHYYGNSNSNKSKVYASRRGGSVSSSTAGRNASPRRFTTHDGANGGTKTSPAIKQPNSEENTSTRSSKIYRGDIRKPRNENRSNSDEIITPDPNDSRGNNRTPRTSETGDPQPTPDVNRSGRESDRRSSIYRSPRNENPTPSSRDSGNRRSYDNSSQMRSSDSRSSSPSTRSSSSPSTRSSSSPSTRSSSSPSYRSDSGSRSSSNMSSGSSRSSSSGSSSSTHSSSSRSSSGGSSSNQSSRGSRRGG